MSFKDWLPITMRNRVALCLAALALVLFVVWNCLPYHEEEGVPAKGITATVLWPEIFSPDTYIDAIRAPDFFGFLVVTVFWGIIFGGFVVLLAVPLWQILHASNFIRLPIAVLTLFGGGAITWIFFDFGDDLEPYWVAVFTLMGLSLFSISASFFLFRNELALREERDRPKVN